MNVRRKPEIPNFFMVLLQVFQTLIDRGLFRLKEPILIALILGSFPNTLSIKEGIDIHLFTIRDMKPDLPQNMPIIREIEEQSGQRIADRQGKVGRGHFIISDISMF
jgi:hypothetical protein